MTEEAGPVTGPSTSTAASRANPRKSRFETGYSRYSPWPGLQLLAPPSCSADCRHLSSDFTCRREALLCAL